MNSNMVFNMYNSELEYLHCAVLWAQSENRSKNIASETTNVTIISLENFMEARQRETATTLWHLACCIHFPGQPPVQTAVGQRANDASTARCAGRNHKKSTKQPSKRQMHFQPVLRPTATKPSGSAGRSCGTRTVLRIAIKHLQQFRCR